NARVGHDGLAHRDRPRGDVRRHDLEALRLGVKAHAAAAQESVQEREPRPVPARDQPVDLSEDEWTKASLAAQIRRQGGPDGELAAGSTRSLHPCTLALTSLATDALVVAPEHGARRMEASPMRKP